MFMMPEGGKWSLNHDMVDQFEDSLADDQDEIFLPSERQQKSTIERENAKQTYEKRT